MTCILLWRDESSIHVTSAPWWGSVTLTSSVQPLLASECTDTVSSITGRMETLLYLEFLQRILEGFRSIPWAGSLARAPRTDAGDEHSRDPGKHLSQPSRGLSPPLSISLCPCVQLCCSPCFWYLPFFSSFICPTLALMVNLRWCI